MESINGNLIVRKGAVFSPREEARKNYLLGLTDGILPQESYAYISNDAQYLFPTAHSGDGRAYVSEGVNAFYLKGYECGKIGASFPFNSSLKYIYYYYLNIDQQGNGSSEIRQEVVTNKQDGINKIEDVKNWNNTAWTGQWAEPLFYQEGSNFEDLRKKIYPHEVRIANLDTRIGVLEEDTGWVNLTLRSGFTAPTEAIPQARRIGNVVYLRGRIQFTMVSGTEYRPLELPEEFRPILEVRTSTAGTTMRGYGNIVVLPGGDILLGFHNGGTGLSAPTWLSIGVSYLVD